MIGYPKLNPGKVIIETDNYNEQSERHNKMYLMIRIPLTDYISIRINILIDDSYDRNKI